MATNEEIQLWVEKRIPLFYGQADVEQSEVHFFLDACNRAYKLHANDVPRQRVLLEEILLRLRGGAYELFRDAPSTSLKEFCSTISQTYLPKFTLEFLRDRLHSTKQSKDESCAQFGRKVQGFALDYGAGIVAKYGEVNALPKPLLTNLEQEAFIRGLLNPIIKSSIAVLTEKTTKELIQVAESLETKIVSSWAPRIPDNNQEIQCQLCDKKGHKANQCSSMRRPPPPTQERVFQQRRFERKFCKYCKRPGHEIEECNTKRFWDNKRGETYASQPGHAQQLQSQDFRRQVNQAPILRLPQQSQDFHHQVTQIPMQRFQSSPRKWQPKTVGAFRHSNYSPRKQVYRNEPTGLEEGFNKLAIKYIESAEEPNQGNPSGLADE